MEFFDFDQQHLQQQQTFYSLQKKNFFNIFFGTQNIKKKLKLEKLRKKKAKMGQWTKFFA